MNLRFVRLSATAVSPTYAHPGDAGADLYADEKTFVPAGWTVAVSTGLAVEIPEGFEMQIRSRSGLAYKGVTVANSPGTIDAGYRGEVKVLLHNSSQTHYYVKQGERIAQAVIAPVLRVTFVETDELSDSERGANGFGSSG